MSKHLSQALILANKDFDLELSRAEIATVEDFKILLTQVVQNLLDHDFARLLIGLYRIDVSEEKVKLVMATNDQVAAKIAILIIDREMEKVITRENYKS